MHIIPAWKHTDHMTSWTLMNLQPMILLSFTNIYLCWRWLHFFLASYLNHLPSDGHLRHAFPEFSRVSYIHLRVVVKVGLILFVYFNSLSRVNPIFLWFHIWIVWSFHCCCLIAAVLKKTSNWNNRNQCHVHSPLGHYQLLCVRNLDCLAMTIMVWAVESNQTTILMQTNINSPA